LEARHLTNDAPSYATDIRPLFRDKDVSSMMQLGGFDLSSYDDASSHADDILAKLSDGSMPCDGAWPLENVEIFRRWVSSGKMP
jgi:hypothetical protein